MPDSYILGRTRLTLLIDAIGQIDGNQVFYPATLDEWGPELGQPDDPALRIHVPSLLISRDGEHTLVDTGFGEEGDPDRSHGEGGVIVGLEQLGLGPQDIDRVIITHAHGDHMLGNTVKRGDRWIPVFPEALYVVQEREAGYVRRSPDAEWDLRLEPLQRNGQLKLIDGTTTLNNYLTCRLTPGHTIGHQIVIVQDAHATAAFVGDLAIRAQSFLHPDWGPDWAWSRKDDLHSRQEIAAWAAENDALLIVGHDPVTPWIRLRRTDGGFAIVPQSP
jgi:glyoxylase-like metal-dependent hydrolase (beta-lactamase superfamily II)